MISLNILNQNSKELIYVNDTIKINHLTKRNISFINEIFFSKTFGYAR